MQKIVYNELKNEKKGRINGFTGLLIEPHCGIDRLPPTKFQLN
jgi:hypothetical protein